jgi:opacity protein-like surface antigen
MTMAENFNHIDQIIRQKFENFEPEPPVQVWDNIRSGIKKNPPPPSSSGFVMPVIVAISLLIFVAGLLHHFYFDNSISALQKADASKLSVQKAGIVSTGSTTTSDLTLQEEFYQTPSEVITSNISSESPDQAIQLGQQPVIPVREAFGQTYAGDRKQKKAKNNPSIAANSGSRSGAWKPGLVQALAAGELRYADAVKYDLSLRDIRKLSGYQENARHNRPDWSIGIYFNPEVTSCQEKSIENTVSYSASILPQMSFNRFFIQSGINMRFTHDKGNYAVDYNRYLGTYEHVDKITFDSTENGVIPTYYTHTVEVYDTVNHYAISETKANYTYLEIPLLVGYRYKIGKFSIFVKAGPAASFLVIKNVPAAGYPEDKARIINVDYQIPARSTVSWQLMMGAGFDYQLADKFSFSLEPTFRYALKPEYSLPDGARGNTTSFGIRAGLNYNF